MKKALLPILFVLAMLPWAFQNYFLSQKVTQLQSRTTHLETLMNIQFQLDSLTKVHNHLAQEFYDNQKVINQLILDDIKLMSDSK